MRSRHAGAPEAAGLKRIAVQPFEKGAASAYFADMDEVRNKLAALPGLTVIARSSSDQYKGTAKPANKIAEELGVSYLLMATVRWQKASAGASRIRVTPELLEVATAGAPAARRRDSFDAGLDDVFRGQGGIAAHVARALRLTLRAQEQRQLRSAHIERRRVRPPSRERILDAADAPTLQRRSRTSSRPSRWTPPSRTPGPACPSRDPFSTPTVFPR
jgi:TolB-like protein